MKCIQPISTNCSWKYICTHIHIYVCKCRVRPTSIKYSYATYRDWSKKTSPLHEFNLHTVQIRPTHDICMPPYVMLVPLWIFSLPSLLPETHIEDLTLYAAASWDTWGPQVTQDYSIALLLAPAKLKEIHCLSGPLEIQDALSAVSYPGRNATHPIVFPHLFSASTPPLAHKSPSLIMEHSSTFTMDTLTGVLSTHNCVV